MIEQIVVMLALPVIAMHQLLKLVTGQSADYQQLKP